MPVLEGENAWEKGGPEQQWSKAGDKAEVKVSGCVVGACVRLVAALQAWGHRVQRQGSRLLVRRRAWTSKTRHDEDEHALDKGDKTDTSIMKQQA